MNSIFSSFLFLSIGLPAQAAIQQTRAAIENYEDAVAVSVLKEGTLEAKANGLISVIESSDTGRFFQSAIGAQYFLTDDFAIGGNLAVFTNSPVGDGIFLDPKASYYFLKRGRFAGFVTQSFSFGPLVGSVSRFARFGEVLISETTLGADYFLSDNISLSPGVTLNTALVGEASPIFPNTGGLRLGFDFKLFFL